MKIIQSFIAVTLTASIASVAFSQSANEARIESLLAQLTLKEKISLLSGASSFGTAAVERLGIHSMRFADGPTGVRSNDGDEATAFPAGITLASSWNPQLLQQVGAAIGAETRAMASHVLLGPNLNLVRSPQSGRNFETYGEDPLLAGQLGIGFVRGVQSTGVAVSAKHFVGNEQETERSRGNSVIDARALHELYLKPFEMVVKEAKPWTVMTAYNRLNGTYMSENESLLRGVLKGQWQFDGVAMSDWGGTHSVNAVTAGLDLEMPGPPLHFGNVLSTAVQLYEVSESAVNDAARRMLRLSARVGALDADLKPDKEVSTAAHRELARVTAAQGITLLKNSGNVLPLDLSKQRKIAVIGPNANAVVVEGGGSAQVIPSNIVSPLDAIKTLVGSSASIVYEQGVDNERFTPAIDGRDLSPTRERTQRGLTARYYANDKFSGQPAKTRVEQTVGTLLLGNDVNLQGKGRLSVRWEGYYWPTVTGEYEFEFEYLKFVSGSTLAEPDAVVSARMNLDGRPLLHPQLALTNDLSPGFFPTQIRRARVKLEAGRSYPINVTYAGSGFRLHNFRLAVRPPAPSMTAAVEAARDADVALVFVGSGTTAETEGRDRDSLALYGEQDALVRAVAAANPRTVVVLHNGGPVAMPWVDQAQAIVEAWLPGQEGNLALADVLFGKVNPSGKLPVSFPKRLQDAPSYVYYPGGRDALYGESVFMGYRYYDKKDIEPLFAFGHGLSYTQFDYGDLRVPATAQPSQNLSVSINLKNSGTRAGAEVVQLYISNRQCLEACPVRELKSFQRVELQPGESRTVVLALNTEALANYDVRSASWQITPGKYRIAVGSSSRDLRAEGEMSVTAAGLQ